MGFRSNPLLHREWLRARRNWPTMLCISLAAVAGQTNCQLFLWPWVWRNWPSEAEIGLDSFLVSVFRVPLWTAIGVLLVGLQRERQSGGWEDIAATDLSTRDILVGWLFIPVLFAWTLHVLMTPIVYCASIAQAHQTGWAPDKAEIVIYVIAWGMSSLERFLFDATACVVVLRFVWRSSFGEGILRALIVVCAMAVAASLVYYPARVIPNPVLTIFLGGTSQSSGWGLLYWAALAFLSILTLGVGEVILAVWAFRSTVASIHFGTAERVKGE